MHLAADLVNSVTPQFVDLGLSNIDALDKVAGLWTPATRFGRPMDFSYWRSMDHIFGETTAVGDAVSTKSDYDYNYKTGFDIWKENKEFERQNISMSRPPLDSTPVGTKTLDAKNTTFVLDSC